MRMRHRRRLTQGECTVQTACVAQHSADCDCPLELELPSLVPCASCIWLSAASVQLHFILHLQLLLALHLDTYRYPYRCWVMASPTVTMAPGEHLATIAAVEGGPNEALQDTDAEPATEMEKLQRAPPTFDTAPNIETAFWASS